MKNLIHRLIALFFALQLLLGTAKTGTEIKTGVSIRALELSAVDISNGYTVRVPLTDGCVRFNRISFSYKATAPVRAVFRYRLKMKTYEEELLLSSKETCASLLLDGYLKKKTASRLISVEFSPIVSDRPCVLSVSDFSCDLQKVPEEDVLYFENDRFKVGVKLIWGGGLCCFEDKQNVHYGNLLNCYDTGRLVQQSYYGPTEIEGYVNGYFGTTRWGYNPVQGGDQFGNTSKLVALEATDKSIRVVCRALDWAQNNMPTQTYYTNVYTLTDRGLRTENTAVDFLQTQWKARAQEIPAFYTISALGTFVFYDGEEPWTDGPLRVEDSLEFWAGKPAFAFKESNTETWCAWTDDSGYGVGLFTPIAESLLAGRFLYDGSADPQANGTNYVAPIKKFVLHFDEPFTYTHHLTAGTVQEIRDTFKTLQ